MKLVALTDRTEIRQAYDELVRRMTTGAVTYEAPVGWHGGGDRFTLYWRPTELIWSLFHETYAENRYWCCYGTTDPRVNANFSIACETNVPYEGRNLRVAGSFARGSDGRRYLTHNGGIGGGRKGVSRVGFREVCQGLTPARIFWLNGPEHDTFLVGCIDDDDLPNRLGAVVREVDRVKQVLVARSVV